MNPDHGKAHINQNNGELIDILKDIAPSQEDTLSRCNFKNAKKGGYCGYIFRTIVTEEGVCYSFNAMNSREIYTNK